MITKQTLELINKYNKQIKEKEKIELKKELFNIYKKNENNYTFITDEIVNIIIDELIKKYKYI